MQIFSFAMNMISDLLLITKLKIMENMIKDQHKKLLVKSDLDKNS